jgi:serine/threonine protein kinase
MDEGPSALASGTRLHEFELIRVLGEGGFGVVYLARDTAQQRLVAVKEYMPSALARRGTGTMVHVRSEREADLFRVGLASFLSEAQMLARFDHPALVRMHRSWEEHGTAYTVMPYYEGITLKAMRDSLAGVPDEALLVRLLQTLLGALGVLHAAHVYHRDISPDNILMQPDGRPVLLDFGAARQVIADRTQSLTSILKPNFAPIEQYSGSGELKQGPWTDLYSLGAVMYFMIVGHAPPPAAARALDDDLPLLAQLARDGVLPVSTSLAAVVDWCLEFRPQRRPHSVAEVIDALEGRSAPPPPSKRERAHPRDRAMAGGRWATTVDVDKHRDRAHAVLRRPLKAHRRALAVTLLPLVIAVAGWSVYRQAGGTSALSPAVAGKANTVPTPPKAVGVAHDMAQGAASQQPRSVRLAKAAARTPRTEGKAPDAPHLTARASCGERNLFSMSMCLRTACARPEFRGDPSCAELADAERRQQETMQRY